MSLLNFLWFELIKYIWSLKNIFVGIVWLFNKLIDI